MHVVFTLALLVAGETAPLPAENFWTKLQELCGKAYAGEMVEGTEPSDADFGSQAMIMHVSECNETEIRIPFHVGENRSRTWVLMRGDFGVRLKHDHRHEDGTPDEITWYGGDAQDPGEKLSLDFPADVHTQEMLPAAASNVWTLALEPGAHFSYALRREEQGRRFRVVFDLDKPVPVPPPAW